MTSPPEISSSPSVCKADILRALSPFARPSDPKGLCLFLGEFVLYWGALAVVLFSPLLLLKVIASIVAGVKLTAFVTLGHDAAHRMLVKNKKLNKWLALGCFIPCVHNYRLWIWDHHEIHHPQTNGEHFDSFTPYSKAEFDSLPRRKQIFERIIRYPNLIGFGIHYLFQRMPRVRMWPTKAVPARHRRSAWKHFAVLVAYHLAFLTMLVLAPKFAPVSAGAAVLLGWIVPMLVFGIVTGGSLYMMHTHRQVPWFKGELDRKGDAAVEYCSTHLRLPALVSKLVHHVFAHSVHHAHPGVPCYYVPEAQKVLDDLLGDRAVTETMSFRRTVETMHACKLYDFEAHQWLDFDGRPTTAPIKLRSTSAAPSPT